MAAILRHRQLLVLHASCAVNATDTVVLTGESGAGKSTTMAALVAPGWHMLSDDIVALRLNDQDCLEILPGAIHVHLHEDAAAALPLDTGGLAPRAWHRPKTALPLHEFRSSTPCAANKFIHLEKTQSAGIRAEYVTGREKLPLLLRSLYGPVFPGEIATRFELFAAALGDVKVLSVARPRDAWTLNEIVGVVTDG
jgi:energy-coupling factor transporter ATP-binding protein EcfA2